jgi:hypothetical protein
MWSGGYSSRRKEGGVCKVTTQDTRFQTILGLSLPAHFLLLSIFSPIPALEEGRCVEKGLVEERQQ